MMLSTHTRMRTLLPLHNVKIQYNELLFSHYITLSSEEARPELLSKSEWN